MNTLIYLAEAWWPLYAIHMVEVSLFIMLVWAVDHWLTLETRLRYALYLLALAKVFVPPVLAVPIPAFLVSTAGVAVEAGVYSGVASEGIAGSPGLVTPFPPAFYLFCMWILSVLIWTGVALWKNMAFRHTLKSAAPVDLASDVSSLNVPGNLRVFAKTDLPSPILVGLIRPRLYLPSHWPSWKNEELRGVVKHELAHFERRDIYVLILQAMATALFGANPLIWLLNRRLMYLRELRCDEAVLHETNLSPAEYGRLLLALVDRRPMPSALTVFFADRGTTLKKRLEHILNYKAGNMNPSKSKLATFVLVGLMIVPFSIREAYSRGDSGPQSSNSAVQDKTTNPPKSQTAESVSGHVDSTEIVSVVYDVNEVDEKPHPVQIVAPDYPENAPENEIDGVVHMKIVVNVDGSVSDVTVLNGPGIFHNAATDAVLQWRFKPAEYNGKVVPVTLLTPIRFSSKPDNVLEFWSVDVKPVLTNPVAPVYPDKARKAGLVGNVFLKFVANVNGTVSHINVIKGKAIFHEAAIDAISQCRFTPAEHEGKPVPVWMTQRISFQLPKPKSVPPPQTGDAEAETGFDAGEVDVKPVVTHSVQPIYPEWARFTGGRTGSVHIKFKVNEDGSVSDVRPLKGQSVFIRPAIDAISQYRFKPAEHEGEPVAVWMTHRLTFQPPKPKIATTADTDEVGGQNVFEIRSVDARPVVVHSVQPVYPDMAKRAGLAGDVALKFKVNVDGSVSDVDAFVLKGGELFRKPAIEAIAQFLYKPAVYEGKPVAVRMTHHFAFARLESQDDTAPNKGKFEGNKVFEISEVDVKPEITNSDAVRPNYPNSAKEAGLAGNVFLKFKINVDGSVSDVRVLRGDEIFHEPAIEAVRQLRYRPAEIGGKPVPVWMTQRIVFALPDHQEEAVSDKIDPGD